MAFNYSPKIVTDGLVLYLDAANTKSYVSGSTTWNDISKGGFNGTLTNGPTFNSSNGGSIVFDGIDDFVTMGNILNNGVLAGTNNKFSLCGWIFRISDTTQGPLFSKNADGNLGVNERQFAFNFRSSRFDFVFIEKPDSVSGYVRLVQTNSTFNTQTWYYACCTYDGSINTNDGLDRVRIYVNGVLQTSALTVSQRTLTNNIDGSIAPLSIGGSVSSLGTTFGNIPARINLAKIYNRVLTQSEITQNFNATRTRFGL